MKKVRDKEKRIIKGPGIEILLSTFIKKALFAVTFVSVLSVSSVIANAQVFKFKWGSFGSGDGQFDVPRGIGVDSLDNVYVADTSNHRVQKFTSDGTFITKWGSFGSGDGQFADPADVAVDSSDNVYVPDMGNNRVQKFTSDGTFITKWGSFGSGDGQFNSPRGIAVDSLDNVYVVDNLNSRVQKFTSDGTFITKWGSPGSGDGQFRVPRGIAVDSLDNVYVADDHNSRVQKFTSDGTFIGKLGSFGSGDGQFNSPGRIGVDSLDNVYVADKGNYRVQKFTSNGTFITKWGGPGDEDGYFGVPGGPGGIAVDSLDNVYVVDPGNDRVQVFGEPLPPTYDATGIWIYSTTNNWVDPGVCPPRADETSITAVTQTGNYVESVSDGITYTGIVSGATYWTSTSYPEAGGTVLVFITSTLSSNTSGSGTVYWYWTDGVYSCSGGSDLLGKRVGLGLIPDSTTVSRGENLGIEVTVTNDTDKAMIILFATKVTLPNGNPYPASGYLFGPKEVTLNPYELKSGHLSHTIPTGAPLGTYTYHGYIGRPGLGIIDEDQFDFEVIEAPIAVGPEDWETAVDQGFTE